MKALTKNGSYIDLEPFIENRDCYTSVRLSKDINYSNINRIEFDFWGEIADIDDKGYMVLPRGEGCNDYTLCFFEKHKDEFEHDDMIWVDKKELDKIDWLPADVEAVKEYKKLRRNT